MGNIPVIITAIGSIIASTVAIISIYLTKKSYNLSKEKIISDIFPQSRIQWISDVRDAICDFISLYFQESNLKPTNRKKLLQSIIRIELFLNYSYQNQSYNNLREVFYFYLNTNDVITDHTSLITVTQKVFDSVLSRAKFEAGVMPEIDKRIRQDFNVDITKLYSYECMK